MGSGLQALAEKSTDVLKPLGQTDVLLYYALLAPSLKNFLKGKMLAAKNWMPAGIPFLIKRGSKEPPIFVEDLPQAVDLNFLELRKSHLNEVEERLTPLQKKVWNYFLPRKLSDFFYATNNETAGGFLDRVFFDLDRGKNVTAEKAQEVAREFAEIIGGSSELAQLLGYKPKIFSSWTGSSFHVYVMLKKPVPNSVYSSSFKCESKKKEPLTLAEKWVEELKKRVDVKVFGGHEKIEDAVVIDPSQTPSGKLARVPLGALHMKSAKEVDGVSVPLELKMLAEKGLVKNLRAYTPKKVLDELKELGKRLP